MNWSRMFKGGSRTAPIGTSLLLMIMIVLIATGPAAGFEATMGKVDHYHSAASANVAATVADATVKDSTGRYPDAALVQARTNDIAIAWGTTLPETKAGYFLLEAGKSCRVTGVDNVKTISFASAEDDTHGTIIIGYEYNR